MSDLIDRQAAIDALKRISFSYYFECGEYLSEDTREIEIINSNKALEAIKALPSAQRTGRWNEHRDYPGLAYLCSECNYFTTVKSYYCPYCGARMNGGDDGGET